MNILIDHLTIKHDADSITSILSSQYEANALSWDKMDADDREDLKMEIKQFVDGNKAKIYSDNYPEEPSQIMYLLFSENTVIKIDSLYELIKNLNNLRTDLYSVNLECYI